MNMGMDLSFYIGPYVRLESTEEIAEDLLGERLHRVYDEGQSEAFKGVQVFIPNCRFEYCLREGEQSGIFELPDHHLAVVEFLTKFFEEISILGKIGAISIEFGMVRAWG
jgi:hypothetical protein